MTNIKYSKRFKLRNGERVDFCPGRLRIFNKTKAYR